MAQLYTYFVCSRDAIEHWADALANGDEAAQDETETEMPLAKTLRNVGDTEFNILARCAAEDDFDVVEAVGEVDLVRALSEDEGPWIVALRRSAIEAVAGLHPTDSVLNRWIKHTVAFNGNPEWCARNLTAEAAEELRTLSRRAIEANLPMFACFFG